MDGGSSLPKKAQLVAVILRDPVGDLLELKRDHPVFMKIRTSRRSIFPVICEYDIFRSENSSHTKKPPEYIRRLKLIET